MVEDEQITAGTAGSVVLHVLPVGGGIVAFSPLPGARGDYRGDLDHLSSWRPAMVISLVTPSEMLDAGAQSLGQDIQDKGTRWIHLPIPRGEAPSAALEETWFTVSKQARKALLGGGRVMINSRDGRGRAGMLALRLMIEAGEAHDEASDRLAAVQRGIFLEPWQRNWSFAAQRDPVPFVRHARSG
ncbi:protein phosphatase [Mameliella alba]|nr:protein phosphatase [Antarctobacter heliothermus]MBY6144895.1 protein phosphatase [Mameliella alba]MBY6160421.1 protein phosphatase [Mameliella alba]MBY6168891.1 protein phosphatase [Mameliella alba]MBY6173888.1 protein phosphatase [Mameliella alba]